ncbi:MAG: 50S ribosomal protein L14e [Ignisphaera sp.]|uniref:Large ribosomal subunit protein eL14 n=1 Tax=Ignisphaera aggregans TaxID=334771 RepID=A0A832AN94_9CREN
MPAIEIGRICVKIAGRESGRKCVIVEIIDENYVDITGPKTLTGVKRRRCNINHIEVLDKKIDIKKGASDEEIMKALEQMNLIDFMKERIRVKLTPILLRR